MRIIVYIGLPKTATTFYQKYLFPFLDKSEVMYNPPALMKKIGGFIYKEKMPNNKEISLFYDEINKISKNNVVKTLLIVNEHLGHREWSPDPKRGAELTKLLFPNAEIILCLRYQSDWLLSLYRHYMDVGGYGNIKRFLNYEINTFIPNKSRFYFNPHQNAIVSIDIFQANWPNYIDYFSSKYKREDINILFFEDFIRDKNLYTKKICNIIGVKNQIPQLDFDQPSNKGRSALTCKIIELKCSLFDCLGIIPRSISAWNLVIKNNKNKGSKFHILFLIIKYAPFQFFMTYFDKILYLDWDILLKSNLRKKLDYIYKKSNQGLLKYVPEDEIPSKYIK
jgi:hypothetical protein